jgi:DNA-directed RNA polymerase subunit RPC12/RpoP
MPDREKVIKGLEMHKSGLCNVLTANGKVYCPYWASNDNCMIELLNDALALLKEQESIKPTAFVDKDTEETRYVCSNCGYEVRYEELVVSGIVEIKHSYCPSCGKKVKWE